jgi:hypothetical protein
MKIGKAIILPVGLFAMVAMLFACQSKGTTYTATPFESNAIRTTLIEVTGDEGELLRIQFDRAGNCVNVWVKDEKGEEKNVGCDNAIVVKPLNTTFFCIQNTDPAHESNTKIYDKIPAYCGNVEELSDWVDIRFREDPRAVNKKCKKVGGHVYCY